jgi:hypothetical protein
LCVPLPFPINFVHFVTVRPPFPNLPVFIFLCFFYLSDLFATSVRPPFDLLLTLYVLFIPDASFSLFVLSPLPLYAQMVLFLVTITAFWSRIQQ